MQLVKETEETHSDSNILRGHFENRKATKILRLPREQLQWLVLHSFNVNVSNLKEKLNNALLL